MDFSGKSIVVTGAGSGIGKGITRQLVELGASVIAVSVVQSELDALLDELGDKIQPIAVDLTDYEATRSALGNLPVVHGLVNSAGIFLHAPFLTTPMQHFDRVWDINVKALVNVSQIVAHSMIIHKIKGAIVNISSTAATRAGRHLSAYSASKGAVDALTRGMALELGPVGIRVSAVNPTFVQTPLVAPYFTDAPQVEQYVVNKIPLRRLPDVSDVSNAVIFLLSDAAAMVNGINMPVDGGYTAW